MKSTYIPQTFREPSRENLLKVMREYAFATVVTVSDGVPFVNHLPILTEMRGDDLFLIGHMARANPQWKHFKDQDALIVFNGPHAYITPQWYVDPMNVPTWNYAAVHASGRPVLVEDIPGLQVILEKSVAEFEQYEPKPWVYDLPEEFRHDLSRAIVGFEMKVSQLEGKFKLSQNREPADREGVLRGLATRSDEMSRKTLELMLSQSLGEKL